MDPGPRPAPTDADERWRVLLLDNPRARRNRRIHRRLPSEPRCKLCAAPFGLPGSLVMPLFDHGRWAKNPKYCTGCFRMLERFHGGAEVECSLLFADVRGSTGLAETMSARDFSHLMGRFHDLAFRVLADHDAFFDKFVGDEIIGIFVPAMAGVEHVDHAVAAARELLRRTGQRGELRVPVGIGVGSGIAYVGSIGEGLNTDLTAMGDLVNTTARLASSASAGQALITAPSLDIPLLAGLQRRTLQLRGKTVPTEVAVLT